MPAHSPDHSPLPPGLAIIHSNQLESLRVLIVEWLRRHPLAPLENEIVLVQSNGMAQWLKLALADQREGLGICAAIAVQLPARFLWDTYQTVLGADAVPDQSLFGQESLTWRLFRLLPERLSDPRFAALRRFLADDQDARKRHQLAACLADLFDQYQVYRADWLRDWAEGSDQLRDAHGLAQALPEEQIWQAELWRTVIEDMPPEQRDTSRALLHERFLAALDALTERPARLPRRIVVFGISSLPHQTLRALSVLGRFCQVLLCVHNPCRHYWADIIEHKELLRAERHRQRRKARMPAELKSEELHLHANPLLAAWGKQGRDYIRLLDELDDPARYQAWFDAIDLFEDYGEGGQRSLLQHVQQAILDLEPLPENPDARPVIAPDGSLVFHIAHCRQRETEILHDQLLALFAASRERGERLVPRDVIVMVPDIDAYAPHIRAVFGQIGHDDPRYIPYSLADQRERGQNPLMIAVEWLLRLPESRCAVSDLLDLLDVPAVWERFRLEEADLPLLHRWIEGAGIRWGLHAEQRAGLDLPAGLDQNAWQFGLKRMLLGYAVGDGAAWADIEPYDEIGGLDAALIGPLAELLDRLEDYWRQLAEPALPAVWAERLRGLLMAFFTPTADRDALILERLHTGLAHWADVCQQATLDEALPLSVVREAWLSSVDEPNLSQRFLAGRVNFCTLMPMRAIPFGVVCLMGMNDGDYPRSMLPLSFDLMSGPVGYRPGDRSRRDDDRYLFLEALLSARHHLYVSWIGRSVQDNGEHPPSLLIAQLRDYLAAGWRVAIEPDEQRDAGRVLLDRLTVEHPLQAFSPRYFLPDGADGHDPRLFSYAREWRAAHAPNHGEAAPAAALEPYLPKAPLNLETLAGFLRHPVKAFFNERLKVRFEQDSAVGEDLEPFSFDPLQRYGLGDELLREALNGPPPQAGARFNDAMARQKRRGELPLASFAEPAQADFSTPAWAAYEYAARVFAEWPDVVETPGEIRLDYSPAADVTLQVEDWLPGLRRNGRGQWAQILVRPQAVAQDGQPKWHNLVRPWVRHLAGCAAGLELHTLQIGPDAAWHLPALRPEQARHWFETLLEAWHWGMQAPLPLACRSAFAWLEKSVESVEFAPDAARAVYEDGYNHRGEGSQDIYLARAFPRFEDLWQDDGQYFMEWAEQLYRPLWKTARRYEAT
ncbi:exodeoxyribonuclease V subunit gamma [Methylomagnum sp.]